MSVLTNETRAIPRNHASFPVQNIPRHAIVVWLLWLYSVTLHLHFPRIFPCPSRVFLLSMLSAIIPPNMYTSCVFCCMMYVYDESIMEFFYSISTRLPFYDVAFSIPFHLACPSLFLLFLARATFLLFSTDYCRLFSICIPLHPQYSEQPLFSPSLFRLSPCATHSWPSSWSCRVRVVLGVWQIFNYQ